VKEVVDGQVSDSIIVIFGYRTTPFAGQRLETPFADPYSDTQQPFRQNVAASLQFTPNLKYAPWVVGKLSLTRPFFGCKLILATCFTTTSYSRAKGPYSPGWRTKIDYG
jgi:hypothetical protein